MGGGCVVIESDALERMQAVRGPPTHQGGEGCVATGRRFWRTKRFPSLQKAVADGGYQGKPTADDVNEQAGIPLEIRQALRGSKGVLRVAQALDR
jgi:hypothetical protein